jgi:hypothetical protein
MRTLREAEDATLCWTRIWLSSRETHYILRDGSGSEHVVATVRWGGTPTELETAEGRWLLRQRGWWLQRVFVAPEIADTGATPFTLTRDWRRRWRLARRDRTAVCWHAAKLASANWVCDSQAGERLMLITVKEASSQPGIEEALDVRGRVSLSASERTRTDAAFTVSVGWHLLLLDRVLSGLGG